MKDQGKRINLLKLDVEGFEFRVLEQIINSHMVRDIDQLIVEMHPDDGKERNNRDMTSILKILKELQYQGFYIANYSPNLIMGRYFNSLQYYPYFDITLARQGK